MRTWQLQQAKQKLSELVQQTLVEGPQVITRHGEEVVVVVSRRDYERLKGTKLDFKEFLLSAPDLSQLRLERDQSLPRDIEL